MKRKLALFMVLAMLVALVPMNVFAASKNSALSVPSVAKNTIFTSTNAPVLKVEEDSMGQWLVGAKTFELELTNAEWAAGIAAGGTITNTVAVSGGTGTATLAITKQTDTVASAILTVGTATSANSDKLSFTVPLVTKATGGEAKVKVVARDSYLSETTVTFANAVSGNTKASIDTKTFADTVTLNSLKIDELVIGTVGTGSHPIELKLPSGFEWTNSTAPAVAVAGGWTTAGSRTFSIDGGDARIATLTLPTITASTTQRGIVYISGLQIKRNSDAAVGDVVMNIKDKATGIDGFTEEGIVVAKYATYDVTVKAMEDPVSIYSGRYETSETESAYKLVKLNIKEEVTNSWLANRITKIQFNDEVKIRAYDFKKNSDISGGTIKTDTGNATVASGIKNVTTTNRNYIEISNASITPNEKAEVEIQFWVSVKGNYTGDIKATVGGSAMSKEQTVVLGKAIAPAAMTIATKDVKIGLKNQPVGDIVITEPAKGVWQGSSDGTKELQVFFDDGIIPNEKGTVTVTKGNAAIGTYRISANTLLIPIKYESTTPAEFTIKGVTVDVNRSVPEGVFEAQVGGDAIVQNAASDETVAKFNKSTAVSVPCVRVITPAPGDTKTIEKVVFTIDTMDYMVGDVKTTADVAPYINEQGRTMLPLRALANALNVSNDNIVWNETDRSVVIFKGDATIKVVIGEMKFTKNGTEVGMDTMAVIKNGRTMLPLRAIGQALGFTPVWDEATRTVTVQ